MSCSKAIAPDTAWTQVHGLQEQVELEIPLLPCHVRPPPACSGLLGHHHSNQVPDVVPLAGPALFPFWWGWNGLETAFFPLHSQMLPCCHFSLEVGKDIIIYISTCQQCNNAYRVLLEAYV